MSARGPEHLSGTCAVDAPVTETREFGHEARRRARLRYCACQTDWPHKSRRVEAVTNFLGWSWLKTSPAVAEDGSVDLGSGPSAR